MSMEIAGKHAAAMAVELKYQPGIYVRIPPGHRLVEHPNRHELNARLMREVRRGEIERTDVYHVADNGAAAIVVKPLREPRSHVPWYIGGAALGLGALVGVGVLLYQTRYVWMALAGVALLVVGALRLLGNHGGACTGLHCAGCRG